MLIEQNSAEAETTVTIRTDYTRAFGTADRQPKMIRCSLRKKYLGSLVPVKSP